MGRGRGGGVHRRPPTSGEKRPLSALSSICRRRPGQPSKLSLQHYKAKALGEVKSSTPGGAKSNGGG